MTNLAQARRLARPRRRSRTVNTDYFALEGGMNLLDSELTIKPGQLRGALNYEIGVKGGYERVGGFERFDGRANDKDYYWIPYRSSATIGPAFTIGETITGGTSLDTGLLLDFTNTGGGDNAEVRSEDLSNAAFFAPSGLTMTADVYTVPPGHRIAMMDKAEKTTVGADFVLSLQTHVPTAGEKTHVSAFFRLNGTNNLVSLHVSPDPDNNAFFDLSTGSVFGGSFFDAGVELIADGIYRCWMITVAPATPPGSLTAFIRIDGNSGESVFVQGLQVIIGADSDRPGYAKTSGSALPIDCGNLVLYQAGVFQDAETLTGGTSSDTATSDGGTVLNGEPAPSLHALYSSLAAEKGTAIAPAGSGAIRGVWVYKGQTYCLRDNAEATQGQLFKASVATGWVLIPMLHRIGFDAGVIKLFPGDAIDNGGATTGTVEAYQITSGSIAVGDAAGWIWVSNLSGTWANNDPVEVGAVQYAAVDGTPATPTIPAGGKYEFRTHSFPEVSGTTPIIQERMYFVGGVGGCLVFDQDIQGAGSEELLIEIDDMMPATLHPTHLAFHNEYLWLGFSNGSIQNSAVTDPLSFNPVFGASEINMGAAVVGFQEEINEALLCFSRNEIRVMEGKSRATFRLGDYNVKTGAHEWSVQRLATAMFFDDRGFGSLQSTDRFGDYLDNTVSVNIQPIIDTLLRETSVKCSQLYRGRNIYRCYFSDGSWISIGTSGRKVTGLMLCFYPDVVPNVCCSEEDAAGIERLFIGADNGLVYQQEESSSFDGAPVSAFIRTAFHHSGSPVRLKKYLLAELDAVAPNAFSITADFRYDDGRAEQALSESIDLSNAELGGYWDEFDWDDFTWDSGLTRIGAFKLEGEGTNVSAAFRHSSTSEKRHTLRGLTISWLPRRLDRRTVHG